MKKQRDLARLGVDAAQVRSLESITEAARQREVLQSRLTAMLSRGDVIEVERQLRKCLGKVAVFAAMSRSLANRPLRCLIHANAQQAAARKDARALALRSSSARPTFR